MTPFDFLLAVLATLGGAFAIAHEEISKPFREYLEGRGWTWRPDGEDFVSPDGGVWIPLDTPASAVWRWFSKLFGCVYCTGFYCAFFATLVVAGHPTTWLWFLTWWAVWGAHMVVASVVLKLRP